MMVRQDSNQTLDQHMYEDLDLESPDGGKNKKKKGSNSKQYSETEEKINP